MTTQTDLQLVEAFLDKGQDAAFMELVQRYQIPVFRHLSYELADPDDAENVCETVFFLAGRRLSEWPKDVEFKSWILDLATEVGQSKKGEPIDSESPRLVDPAVFFRQSVHRALQALDPEQRALLVAVELEGKRPEDIADERGVPLTSITESLAVARSSFTETMSRKTPASEKETRPKIVTVRPGEIIDNRYRVEQLLGEGGMASVFKAEHLRIKRPVAVKTLRPSRQAQAMIRERFVREAEVLGRLAHPNFVDVSDFGESSEGFAYLVMELLEGRPLSQELDEVGAMGPLRALKIIREVVRGLEFAHSQGIIHRDIKPDNIVLLDGETESGFAKILDLGIASTEGESGSERDETALYGTPAYMAPEQVQGGRIDGRVDLYAVGVTLFELLTGELPFQGATIQYILVQQLTERPPRLEDVLGRQVPEPLQALLDRCLAKDPKERFPSATALREEIEVLLSTLDEGPDEPNRSPRPPRNLDLATAPTIALPAPKKKPVWALVLVGLITLGVIGWWLASSG